MYLQKVNFSNYAGTQVLHHLNQGFNCKTIIKEELTSVSVTFLRYSFWNEVQGRKLAFLDIMMYSFHAETVAQPISHFRHFFPYHSP